MKVLRQKGGNLLKRTSWLQPVAAVVLGALLLGACGSSSHVVSGVPSGPSGTTLTSTPHASGDAGTASHGPSNSSGKSTAVNSKKQNPVASGSTTPATVGSTGSRGSSGSGSSGSQPTSPVNQQTLNAFDAQLGALGQSLSQAVSGVTNTQADS
jgi:hypothetical protein